MGRHRHDKLDLGFNLSLTRDNLLEKLLATGAIDVGKRHLPPEPDRTLPEDERDEALWERAAAAALVHAGLHGVPCMTREGGDWRMLPSCPDSPCKASALSFALSELCDYWRDRHAADLRVCLDEVHIVLQALDPGIPAVLMRAAQHLLGDMNKQRETGLALAAEQEAAGNHDAAAEVRQAYANADELHRARRTELLWARRLARALNTAIPVSAALSHSTVDERSPHRPLPSKVGRGRPKESLLSAIVQHLKHGGFERREILDMVAGIDSGAAAKTPAAQKERVRDRLRGEDCRTIRPYEE